MRILSVTETCRLACDVDSAWSLFADIEAWPRWHPAVACAFWRDGAGGWRAGRRFHVAFEQGPRPWFGDGVVLAADPPRELRWSAWCFAYRPQFLLRLAPAQSGTHAALGAQLSGWAARFAAGGELPHRFRAFQRSFLDAMRAETLGIAGSIA
ncbi:MAG: SRPBCC family protein [Planctomycetes bacterium]|nr:SRPBCC family protein [Planctomycetota bacterium]